MSTLKNTLRNGAIALAVTAGLATALVAVAHPDNGPGMMGRGGPGMMTMGGGHGPMFAGHPADAKFHQDRLGELKSQLGITAQQQPAWDAFVAQAKTMQTLHQSESAATLPERMQQHQKVMGPMSEALTKLYEVLTPQQREVFDRSHGPLHRHG